MPTVKFYLNPCYLTDNYCPEAIQLAEGFLESGWIVVGNIDYWKRGQHWLIPIAKSNQPVDLVVMDHRFVHHTKPWVIKDHVLNELEKNCPRVLLERQSGQETRPQWNRDGWLDFFHIICATHRTTSHPSHPRIIPWQIGVISEAREMIPEPSSNLNHSVLCNFRVGHDVRGDLVRNIEAWLESNPDSPEFVNRFDVLGEEASERDRALNQLTGGRFNPPYFAQLGVHTGVLAFGGYLAVKPFEYTSMDGEGNVELRFATRLERKIRRMIHGAKPISSRHHVAFQWDSFRWWETLVAPCAPVTLDFEYWGLDLPVLPVEGQHYVGIQELDGRSVARRLSGLGHERLEEIGSAGKAWFEEHYSPRAQAGRLLHELSSRGHSIPD